MLVETGQQKVHFFFKLWILGIITDLKYQRIFACECGLYFFLLVAHIQWKLSWMVAKNLFNSM